MHNVYFKNNDFAPVATKTLKNYREIDPDNNLVAVFFVSTPDEYSRMVKFIRRGKATIVDNHNNKTNTEYDVIFSEMVDVSTPSKNMKFRIYEVPMHIKDKRTRMKRTMASTAKKRDFHRKNKWKSRKNRNEKRSEIRS